MPHTHETNSLELLFQPPNWHDAIAYWVPIALRERVLAAYRTAGIPVRVRDIAVRGFSR